MNSDDREQRDANAGDRIQACDLCADVGMRSLHVLAQPVADDDLDAAIALGLLEYRALADRQHLERHDLDLARICDACLTLDRNIVLARDARLRALAARERFRAREARLRQRADERARRREAASLASNVTHTPQALPAAPALPPAAAAALARAKAKAAARGAKE